MGVCFGKSIEISINGGATLKVINIVLITTSCIFSVADCIMIPIKNP
jgi:hypothetical protein